MGEAACQAEGAVYLDPCAFLSHEPATLTIREHGGQGLILVWGVGRNLSCGWAMTDLNYCRRMWVGVASGLASPGVLGAGWPACPERAAGNTAELLNFTALADY